MLGIMKVQGRVCSFFCEKKPKATGQWVLMNFLSTPVGPTLSLWAPPLKGTHTHTQRQRQTEFYVVTRLSLSRENPMIDALLRGTAHLACRCGHNGTGGCGVVRGGKGDCA